MWFVTAAVIISPFMGPQDVKHIKHPPPFDLPLVYEIQANSEMACNIAAGEMLHDWMRRYGVNWNFEVQCEKEESI